MHLFTTVTITGNDLRNEEYKYAIRKNIENEFVDHITIFTETDVDKMKEFLGGNSKLIILNYNGRVTFRYIIDASNQWLSNKIVGITNADVFFDNSLSKLDFSDNYTYCLTRWAHIMNTTDSYPSMYINNGKEDYINYGFDSYIFKAPINVNNINFGLGVEGCDNRFAYELHASGYKAINPGMLIKTHHVHGSDYRPRNTERVHGQILSIKQLDKIEYKKENIDVASQ